LKSHIRVADPCNFWQYSKTVADLHEYFSSERTHHGPTFSFCFGNFQSDAREKMKKNLKKKNLQFQ